MQITIDTANAMPAELALASRFLHDLAALLTAPAAVTDTRTAERQAFDAAAEKTAALQKAYANAQTTRTFADIPEDRPDAGSLPADDLQAAVLFGKSATHIIVDEIPVFVPFVPPAPPLAASPASVPTVPAAAPSAGVDSKGLPWDPRIHASTKVKNADGSWRQRRGLNDDALLARVEAELRQVMSLPRSPAPPVVPAVPAPPIVAAIPPIVIGTAAPATFQEFMMAATMLVQQGKKTADSITVALQSIGLPNIMGLASRPDMLVDAWAVVNK